MNEWIAAAIAAGAGLIIGTIAGRLTQTMLSRERRPELVRSVAAPIGSLVFSAILIAGLMTALGFVNKEALDEIPNDLVDYIPSVLSAAIVLIGANVLAQLARTALDRIVARMGGSAARNIPVVTRAVIMSFGAILASAQLGVDTTIINIAVAALLFGIALAAALMIGLGSRSVTEEVAAGRALRRILQEGDLVVVGDVRGTIASIQSVSVEVDVGTDATVLIPHTQLLAANVSLQRRTSTDTT